MDFNNKTVLVTGSSKGLGKECIKLFAKYGANVVINYNTSYDDALGLRDLIKGSYGTDVELVKCDVSDEKEVKEMVEFVINRFGKIDILVNNAGIAIDCDFIDKNYDNFKKILEVNVIGTFLVSKYIIKHMIDNKCGNIINISSTNGINTNYVESLDYDASKASVISLTHNLARYGSPYVNVNCICPGWMDTDMNKDISLDFRKKEEDKILLKRFGNVEEVANLVLFLASDKASYINDSIIRIDGGVNND